jgi:hypothetical protein
MIDNVVRNHQNQLEQMANGAMFATNFHQFHFQHKTMPWDRRATKDLVEDLTAAANDGNLRAMAPELGGILEADAGSTTSD